jgi:hypothetical protein
MSGIDPQMMSSMGGTANGISAMESANAASGFAGIPNPFSSATAYQAVVPGLTSSGPNSQAAMLAAQTGDFGLGGLAQTAGSAYAPGSFGSSVFGALSGSGSNMSPGQMMMAGKLAGGGGQQQQQPQQAPQGQIRRGQQVNVSDPIGALLAPKRKKREPISLL